MKVTVIWDMMPCMLVDKYYCFEEPAASIIMVEDFVSYSCQNLRYQCCNMYLIWSANSNFLICELLLMNLSELLVPSCLKVTSFLAYNS